MRALGLDPHAMPATDRQAGVAKGRAGRDTPQEAALLLAVVSLASEPSRQMSATLRDWVLQGKLDLNKSHVHEAFHLASGRLSEAAHL
ncbi:MAG: hypothetical protein V4530_00320 [Pseudomonadota bacterium]